MLTPKEYKNLFHRLYPNLCLFANKYVGDLEASKDIVQEVFIKVWQDKVDLRNDSAIKSYLYTSVKNKSLDYLKSRRYKSTDVLPTVEFEKLEAESFFLREVMILETSNIIDEAINTLPNKCAQIVRLSIKSFSNNEIAKELGLSINTIKAQKRIAYKRLRPLLKDYVAAAVIISEILK